MFIPIKSKRTLANTFSTAIQIVRACSAQGKVKQRFIKYIRFVCFSLLILGCDDNINDNTSQPIRPAPEPWSPNKLVLNGDLFLMSQGLADPRLKLLMDNIDVPIKSASLSNNQLSAIGLQAFLQSATTAKMTSLNLNRNKLSDAGAQVLSTSSQLASLQYLQLASNQITAKGATSLSGATGLQLLHLNLSFNPIGDAGAIALSSLKGVRKLSLEHSDVAGTGARALLTSIQVPELHLQNNPIGTDGLHGLTTLSPHLVKLYLESCQLSLSDIKALTGATAPYLRSLAMQYNDLSDVALTAIAQASWFSTLEVLSITANNASPEARRDLIKAWGERPGLHVYVKDL